MKLYFTATPNWHLRFHIPPSFKKKKKEKEHFKIMNKCILDHRFSLIISLSEFFPFCGMIVKMMAVLGSFFSIRCLTDLCTSWARLLGTTDEKGRSLCCR